MSVSVPTIDFGAFEGRDPEAHARVVRQVADACERVGFFFASNHGIEERVLSDALRHARGFFEQPLEAKMRVADLKKGYIPVGGCDNAVRPSSMHEKFSCGPVDVDENDAYYAGADARAALYFGEPNRWPSAPSGFRDAYESYYRAVAGFVDTTHRAFAEALGAPETFFAKSSKKHVSNLVALRYPPVADPSDAGFPLERVRPHTDPTDVTVLLFEDGPRGLQVLPDWANGADPRWIDPAPENAAGAMEAPKRNETKTKTKLLVNLGDATQFWTNDLWRSTRHRVVVRDAEDARRDRLSLVFFHAPDYDARVDARALAEAQKDFTKKKVVSASRPARYPPFEASDRTHFAQLARDARGARDRQVIDANTNERVGLTEQ